MRRAATILTCMALAACASLPHAAHGQERDGPAPGYEIYVPDVMIRGESYRGLVVSNLPADGQATFRFGSAGGDIILPDSAVLESGRNHALFDIRPVQSTILSGIISTGITVIPPDGEIREIPVETHPGVGIVSRLWIVGPGSGGVVCDDPGTTTTQDIAGRAADGVFDAPDPGKEIRTRLSQTTIHVFLTDRYCTPVTAPPGGVSFAVSSDTPALTFGGGRAHVSGVIPQGYNSAVLDVYVGDAGAGGVIYATGDGVSPDSIRIENEPVRVEVRLGVGPSVAMESSYVTWYVWLERDGEQYVPDGPVSVYLTTDNPVLASFDPALVGAGGPALHSIRPHHAFLLDGVASGVLHTGTPAVVGDLRLLSVDRDVTVTAHVEGIGSATTSFQIGAPGSFGEEFRVDTDRIRECMKEAGTLPDGFYSQDCNEMWHRLLVASHFFDITDSAGEPLDSEADTIAFLDSLFGGDNTESGAALYRLVDRINEYSISDVGAAGGLAGDLTELLGAYLRTSEIDVTPVESLGVTAEMIERLPDDPPPNRLALEAFPGRPGTANVVVSTLFGDDAGLFPVYVPDGVMTLSSDSGLSHPPEMRTYGSAPRPEAPGTRPSAVVVPVTVHGGGTFTASLGGVGGGSVQIHDMVPAGGKRLHVSTLPGGGERDLIAIISVLDSDGLLTAHSGDIHVEAGQGASEVELAGWRGGGGMVRGSVDGVGEIIIHAPGIGGGTALTTPVRHEAELSVWHPERVHVAEEFPVVAHALDSGGLPIRKVPVGVSGAVETAGAGLKLKAGGEVPIVAEYGGMFHGSMVEGFLNAAGAGAAVVYDVVELHDTVVVRVDAGAMPEPTVSVTAGGLLFSGEGGRWEAVAAEPGSYTIGVSIEQDGWERYTANLPVRVAHLIDVTYDAVTVSGQRVDADLTLCGEAVLPDSVHRLEPGVCAVSAPAEIRVGGVQHRLDSLTVNKLEIQPGASAGLDTDTEVVATYRGEIVVEATAAMPDGTATELLWGRYQPGDVVTVTAEPRYEFWGLVWDRPERWVGLPQGAAQSGGTASWTAAGDAAVTVEYARDLTYLVVAGAAALSVPIIVIVRKRIPGLRFR